MDPLAVFATNVRDARIRAGKTLQAVADDAGLELAQIGKIERGRHDPGVRTVARLARGLDVDIASLFVGVPLADDGTPRRSSRTESSPDH